MSHSDPARILIAGTDGGRLRRFAKLARTAECEPHVASSLGEAKDLILDQNERFDAMVLCGRPSGEDEMGLVAAALRHRPYIPLFSAAEIPPPDSTQEHMLHLFAALSRSPNAIRKHACALVGQPMERIRSEVTEATLGACGGNIVRAAEMLQISPSTIYRQRGRRSPPENVNGRR